MDVKRWHLHKWTPGVPFAMNYPLMTVHQLLEEAVRDYPDHPFLIFNDVTHTYRRINEIANQVAQFLTKRGIRHGDRVAMFLPNVPHFPAVFFGILKAGAVCVTCNPTYTAAELHHQLNDCGARCLFAMDHPSLYPTACAALKGTAIETVIYCNAGDFLPAHQRVIGRMIGKIPQANQHEHGHLAFAAVRHYPRIAPQVMINPQDDLALIQYTGGTTGVPKGASLTHFNIIADLLSLQAWVRPDDEHGQPGTLKTGGECFIGVLPWFHAYGLVMNLLAAVRIASKVVCIPDPRAGKVPFADILRAVEQHHATILNGVPTLFSAIIHHPDVNQYDLRSLKLCGCGAAPLAVELARQFEAKTGATLYEGYGMTETAGALTCNPTNRRDRKLGSLGIPIPDIDVIVVDDETGTREMALGEEGEIAASGPQIMRGYWGQPEENAKVFRTFNGKRYLLTGDIGRMDEEGFLWLTDRKKDLVIVGGYKAYPKEIEEVLYAHPKIALAAVVGVPHSQMGQTLKAYIKVKAGESLTKRDVISYCKERLAGYKVPREIEFRDMLPTSPIGKVLKRELQS